MSSSSASGYLTTGKAAIVRAECDVPGLYVRRVVIAADGEPDMAVLVTKPQDEDGADIRFERVLDVAKGPEGVVAGRKVTIWGDAGSGTRQVLLHGRILGAGVRAAGRGEEIEYTVLGLKHELSTEKVFGCWSYDNNDQASHLQAIPTVFNPDGRPNKRKTDAVDTGSRARVVFEHDHGSDQAELWTAAAMARYCATAERKDDVNDEPRVFETTAQVGGELAPFSPFDVNVEGLDILAALVRIAGLCSHSFVFRYGETRAASTLRFFKRNLEEVSAKKRFVFPQVGALDVEDRGRLIDTVDMQLDWSGVVNQFDCVAPPKVYESTFVLKAGWLQTDVDAALGTGTAAQQLSHFLRETDPETSSDWGRFKNIGRRWILNETGRDQVYPDDDDNVPWDFSGLFGVARYARRFRPFLKDRPTRDDAGLPSSPRVHVTFGSIQGDIKLGGLVRMLEDRAGIYFNGRPMVMPNAFMDTGLEDDLFPSEVSIEAAVAGDQSSPFGIIGTAVPNEVPLPSFGIVRLDDAFRQNNKNSDDAEAIAQKLVDDAAAELGHRREVGSVTCPFVSNQYAVGDVVDRIEGRDLEMKSIIMKVSWDFETQSTEFALQVPGIDTESRSREPSALQGADVGARTDRETKQVSELLAHTAMGHPVRGMLDDALRGYDPFAGEREGG